MKKIFIFITAFGIISGWIGTVPAARAQDACMETPTVWSVSDGNWNDPGVWNTGTVPEKSDWVLNEHTLAVPDLIDLGDGGICNNGILQSRENFLNSSVAKIEIHASSVHNSGDIIGENGKNGVCEVKKEYRCYWYWHWGWVCGWVATGVNSQHATSGSGIEIHTEHFINDITGRIQAGNGGNDIQTCWDKVASKGGNGGSAEIFSNGFVNQGIIQAGNAGNAESYHTTSRGGNGGDLRVIANVSDFDVESENTGFLIGGNGGYSRTQAGYGIPGKGGDLDIFLKKLGGNIKGSPGARFSWDPVNLKAGSDLKIDGFDEIEIFTDQGGTIDLTQLQEGAVSGKKISIATKSLNGEGGTVDLSGVWGKVFKAEEKLEIFADNVITDNGVLIEDLAESPSVTVSPGKLILYAALSAEKQVFGDPGVSVSIPIKLINNASGADTYSLKAEDSAGWNLEIPNTVTVEGFSTKELFLNVVFSEISNEKNMITVTAVSQTYPAVIAVADIGARVNISEEDLQDSDGDGLKNYEEKEIGTDFLNPDTDGDVMTDGWEVAYGLNPLVDDALENPDGDCYTNIEEYHTGTDPSDPSDQIDLEGDLDGDCDADRNDISIIRSFLNKPASECEECDMDGDGKITVLDARKLMGLCTCSGCVCP
ncbi:MAG: hypothetical protein GY749_00680 [Desulfobacteraceae bacterium]|nr:hypothetical protein [Desulfobacteraceae bacterium]